MIVLLVCLHLFVVLARSFNTVIPKRTLIPSEALNNGLNVYTEYTVMQADYAFFSPDVGYSPFVKLKVQQNTDSFYIPFEPKGEAGIRFFTSLSAFSNTPEARELMTRSWAAYALGKHPLANIITVSVFVSLPPTIAQFRHGQAAKDSLIFEVKYKVND